jgi:hypothetical protein
VTAIAAVTAGKVVRQLEVSLDQGVASGSIAVASVAFEEPAIVTHGERRCAEPIVPPRAIA